ncbi:DUF362 domain-containing protein [Carboxydothermus ferrireducens]|uniref:Uncharacterized protein (DUF362 family) n=1 Tax=Carboxydothermus ferrireducens DSM 11255 TaxID=1119529 RepID=A0ABX2RBB0_9THEO|nr:DUF362 domain-containing protein [Carboxydothermus ferrireducens]NYE58439.1 uncharacterized protein (DUF362 family) [Carboxydothermus ferrireducens DSM 11255]
MTKPVVSIVKFEDAYHSLRKALELCDGLSGLKKDDKILIKPNLVSWDFNLPFPPFGVVTTSAVMAALVRILKEEGFSRLTIGEGSLMNPRPMGRQIFKVLGYEKLAEKYGVELVDFNEEKFTEIDFGPIKLSVANRALKADKIINLPVLKTHNQCKISLGIKNLKGTISRRSKTHCHGKDWDLEHTFPHLATRLPVALTIIDGVFVLEKGPGPTGKAYRKNLIIASTDILAADIAGAEIIGYRAEEIEHLRYFAGLTGRSLDLQNLEIRGEDLNAHRQFIDYDWEWQEGDLGPIGFAKRGITGIAIRKYDSSLCTGCSGMYNPMLIMFMSAFKGKPFPNVEVVSGKRQLASPGFDYTVLFGKCVCELNKDNPNIKHAIALKGCPPSIKDLEEGLKEAGIFCNYDEYVNYRHYIFNRYKKEEGFDLELYSIS